MSNESLQFVLLCFDFLEENSSPADSPAPPIPSVGVVEYVPRQLLRQSMPDTPASPTPEDVEDDPTGKSDLLLATACTSYRIDHARLNA